MEMNVENSSVIQHTEEKIVLFNTVIFAPCDLIVFYAIFRLYEVGVEFLSLMVPRQIGHQGNRILCYIEQKFCLFY